MSTTSLEQLRLDTQEQRDEYLERVQALGAEIKKHAEVLAGYYHGTVELPADRSVVGYRHALLAKALHYFERLEARFTHPATAVNALLAVRADFGPMVERALGEAKIVDSWYVIQGLDDV